MLDQRGTGRSTPVGALPGLSAAEQADYLKHFRADSIVRDAEAIRAELGVERWSVLGQSFGGFCVMTYLSIAPEGLREAFVTGGLAPVGRHVDEIYRATYERILERNRRYYERYPEDRARVRALVERLDAEPLILPTGDRLTARRFRQAGNKLGMSDGAEDLHALVELPPDSPAFRHDAQDLLGFERNPIYAILHESSYADGVATRWSAERVMPAEYADTPELFTGEHVYSWMFEDYGALAPLRDAAELLARLRMAAALRRERSSARTRSRWRRRSTPTTPTSSGPSRRRPPRSSAARAPGSPASTSTTACARTATASWVA